MFTALAIFIFVSATLAIGIVLGAVITLGAGKPHLQVVTRSATRASGGTYLKHDASMPRSTVERAA